MVKKETKIKDKIRTVDVYGSLLKMPTDFYIECTECGYIFFTLLSCCPLCGKDSLEKKP